jgi:hypothetical protein
VLRTSVPKPTDARTAKIVDPMPRGTDEGQPDHQQAGSEDDSHVKLSTPHINNALQEVGLGQVRGYLDRHAQWCEHGC